MRGEGGGGKWRVIGGKDWVEREEETNKHSLLMTYSSHGLKGSLLFLTLLLRSSRNQNGSDAWMHDGVHAASIVGWTNPKINSSFGH